MAIIKMPSEDGSQRAKLEKANVEEKRLPDHDGVTEGKVVEKTPFQKAAGAFFAEDLDNIKASIYSDYIRPRFNQFIHDSIRRVKEFISDTSHGMLDSFLFGQSRDSRSSYRGSNSNYVKFYNGSEYGGSYNSNYYRTGSSDSSGSTRLKIVTIPSYGKAREVLNDLRADIQKYACTSVGNYYQLVKVNPTKLDFAYGWRDIPADTPIEYYKGEYIIKLPLPVSLD